MKRYGTLWVAAILAICVIGSALAVPTAVITVQGYSPRMVAADANDIYTTASTGLSNVGVGELMYLAGNPTDTSITAWAWELTSRPNNSIAELSTLDQKVVTLRPDLAGTYTVTVTVTNRTGNSAPVSIKVNAANFVGVGNIIGEAQAPECAGCHGTDADVDYYSEWNNTKHASMFSRNYNGADGTAYRSVCISCHTTGYNTDQAAVNAGFDDKAREEGWTFLDSAHGGLRAGTWEAMMQNYPNTAKKANIQCETCHGPGSRHLGNVNDNRIDKTLDYAVCAKCHDSGSHHIFPDQWKKSKHFNMMKEARVGCTNCHSGAGFVDKLTTGHVDSLITLEYMPVSCQVCHDPHSDENPNQLRTVAPYTMITGQQEDLGKANLCLNCHHARRDATTQINTPNARIDPHESPQGDMFVGVGAVTFGRDLGQGPHKDVIENGCIGCHMSPTPTAGAGMNNVGSHTFLMSGNGVDHTEVCAPCHGEKASFEEFEANGDWDRDGTVESVEAELAGMMNTITSNLPLGTANPNATYTVAQKQAYWNYAFVRNDGSNGMHNAFYARDMLQAAIDNLPATRTCRLTLARGWNTVSLNVIPARALWVGANGADVLRMFANVQGVEIVKNDAGQFWAPALNFNNIAYWNLQDGYQIKVSNDVNVDFTGVSVAANADVPLTQGWNTIPYYPTYYLSADAPSFYVVSPILNHVVVAKDDLGRFMLPAFSFSNMSPWAKGKGYQVKVDANVTLNYPAAQNAGGDAVPNLPEATHWVANVTSSSLSLLVIDLAGNNGDQVGAFNANGVLVGAGTVNGGRCGISVWGDDQATTEVDGLTSGEAFALRTWNASTGVETSLNTEIVLGAGFNFKADDVIVAKANGVSAAPATFSLGMNYPNPFNSATRINFSLAEASKVSIKVFDLAGRTVATLVDGQMNAGSHVASWNAEASPAGLYLVKMEAGSFNDTRKITLLK